MRALHDAFGRPQPHSEAMAWGRLGQGLHNACGTHWGVVFVVVCMVFFDELHEYIRVTKQHIATSSFDVFDSIGVGPSRPSGYFMTPRNHSRRAAEPSIRSTGISNKV
eukprot:CAMPEP_0114264830 /NCGR_PEP_ID=MMETSP0058-20121206/23468_1 /TAXON_ID=36894 /ORGANISM="Pyramimonas parkeae, CCMP726" /LENGTH=107 /DNA_ID=CAMNT_0001381635 /DNA_START=224 /DNA_END=543 /DNA_ORIENTATION=-